jgi:hypothetical protein
MRRTPLITSGLLLLTSMAFAAPAKPHAAWGAGIIESVDPAARSLVVKQGAHEMTFAVAPTAQVLEGKSTLALADLSKDVGHQVKVRYTVDNGTKTADRVEVSAHGGATHPAK